MESLSCLREISKFMNHLTFRMATTIHDLGNLKDSRNADITQRTRWLPKCLDRRHDPQISSNQHDGYLT